MREELLRGGFVTEVVRVGDTVRRRPGGNAEFVHRLLEWLERAGWDGATCAWKAGLAAFALEAGLADDTPESAYG